jgi:hypothetical protein
MRLTATAAQRFEHGGARLVFCPPEIVILRDDDKDLIDYADTDETRRIRSNLVVINSALAAMELTYQGRLIRSGDMLEVDGKKIAARNALHRVFNRRSFDRGGRFYGAWWQNIKSDERCCIRVNGSVTVEHDYSQIHPRLLYALAGKPLAGDAYAIEGWDRPLVKEAVNTLINADDELSAMQSIAQSIGGKGQLGNAQKLTEQIKAKHSGIADSFGTGAGLRLMRIDSDMAESVQLKLIGRGIVGLPIHDSFIVEERLGRILEEIMEEAFELKLRCIGGRRTTPAPLTKKVPQYGGGGEAGTLGLAADDDGVEGADRGVDQTGQPANDNRPSSTTAPSPGQQIGGIKPPTTLATAAPANGNGVNTAVDRDSRSGNQTSPSSSRDNFDKAALGPLGDSLDYFAPGAPADEAEVTKLRDPRAHSGSAD